MVFLFMGIKYYRWLCILTFELIVLGGAVRALKAGLACPDWPLCFGDFIPDFHPLVYLEFIHRAIAGVVALGVFYLCGRLIKTEYRVLALVSLVLILFQVAMGGLTVLLELQAYVVTLHLGLATALFGCLIWIYFSLKQKSFGAIKPLPLLVLLAVYVQILLGGSVASHNAALVCPDFPLCHGEWIPTLQGSIGLQVLHRLSAYLVLILVLSLGWNLRRSTGELLLRSRQIMILVLIQVALGISNVLYLAPPVITVLHLASAELLYAAVLRVLYLSRTNV